MAGSGFHQFLDPRQGGMPPVPVRAHLQHALSVDVPGQHGASGPGLHRKGFTGHGGGIQDGIPFRHRAVQRDTLSGAHFNHGTGPDLRGRNVTDSAALPHMDGFRPQVHQFAHGPAGTAHRALLEIFSHAVEKHHPDGFGIIPQEHRSQGGNAHQEIFIHGTPVPQPQKSRLQYIPAYQQVGRRICSHAAPGIASHHQGGDKQGDAQHGGHGPDGVSRAAAAS